MEVAVMSDGAVRTVPSKQVSEPWEGSYGPQSVGQLPAASSVPAVGPGHSGGIMKQAGRQKLYISGWRPWEAVKYHREPGEGRDWMTEEV